MAYSEVHGKYIVATIGLYSGDAKRKRFNYFIRLDGNSGLLPKTFGNSSGFCVSHNLAVDEYYHESPSWSFRFRNPKGGGAHVQLERLDDLSIRVFGAWYIDEYETFTRYRKWTQNRDLRLENIDLREELEASLNQVLAWEQDQLTPHPDYKKVWSLYSKKEFPPGPRNSRSNT